MLIYQYRNNDLTDVMNHLLNEDHAKQGTKCPKFSVQIDPLHIIGTIYGTLCNSLYLRGVHRGRDRPLCNLS